MNAKKNEKDVDIISLAYDYALKDQSVQAVANKNVIKAIAPAKVNLSLRVGQKIDGEYHEVNTIMHTLALHDVLYVKRAPYVSNFEGPVQTGSDAGVDASITNAEAAGGENNSLPHVKTIMIGCDGIEVPQVSSDDNLVTKAVRALCKALSENCESAEARTKKHGKEATEAHGEKHGKEATEVTVEAHDKKPAKNPAPAISENECIEVRVEKHIPAQAGLGGGSSDAAAALLATAKLLGVGENDPIIETCAKQLGSDVAFFLRGGCAQYSHKGDEFVRALAPAKKNVLLVKPAEGLSTAAVYKAFDEVCAANEVSKNIDELCAADINDIAEKAAEKLDTKADANVGTETETSDAAQENSNNSQLAENVTLSNNLTPAAEKLLPLLREMRTWLNAQTCVSSTLLCGSGSCICAFCDTFESAMRLSAAHELQNCWTRTTTLTNLRAAVIPFA